MSFFRFFLKCKIKIRHSQQSIHAKSCNKKSRKYLGHISQDRKFRIVRKFRRGLDGFEYEIELSQSFLASETFLWRRWCATPKLPLTDRKTEKLIFGSVFTWHWNSPESRICVDFICKIHESESEAWWELKRWSLVNVNTSLVSTCKSDFRIQETWKKGTVKWWVTGGAARPRSNNSPLFLLIIQDTKGSRNSGFDLVCLPYQRQLLVHSVLESNQAWPH